MANYSTLLKTWGDTGSEFPDGYSYMEGEQPVDAWDNFALYNTIEDLKHLIDLTNDRIESDKGTDANFPASPESAHIYHDETNEALHFYDSTASTWRRVLAADGDTLEGALDAGGFNISNIGGLTMAGSADLASNDLVDGATTLWDSTNRFIPTAALENDAVTVTAGSGLAGGGSVSLGSSITLSVDGGNGSGLDADTVDGKHADELGMNVEEDGAVAVSGATAVDFTGHLNVIDDGDGTVTIDPTHNHDDRYYTDTEANNRFLNASGDTTSGVLSLGADLQDDASTPNTIWDSSNRWVPQSALENDTLTVTAGSGLSGGGGVSLGSSTTLTHGDTSTQGNVNTSGGTIIDYVSLDGYGHVTNMGTRNLDNRYYNEGQQVGDADTVDGKHASQLGLTASKERLFVKMTAGHGY